MKKVAVIGECMVELFKNKKGLYKQTFGGDSFNFAVYLKRSFKESDVEYITVLGEDELSLKMLNFFHKQKLKTTYIDKIKNKYPGLYIIDTKNGERSFSYWRGESAARELFLTMSLEKLKEDLLDYDLIYFSAISLAIMSEKGRENLFKIVKKARAAGVKIAFDSNYRARLYNNEDEAREIYSQAINYCDIFLPSRDDEIELFGEMSTSDIINRSLSSGVSEIIISSGKEDIVYHYEDETKTIKTKRLKKIVDSTSAGDSFNAQYLASRLEGKTILKSIKKAKKLASKVIMYQGAIMPKDKHA
jgi:2-dehydro-3-deoxygluconokinase